MTVGDEVIAVNSLGKKYDLRAAKVRPSTVSAGLRAWYSNLRRPEDPFWALREVDFEVKRGEALGIIGRNGAGKSTLLKVLARIIEPTEGEVRIRGRVGSLLEVGTGFHPELTGRENIYLNGAIIGMKKREIVRKFDAIVSFSETERFLDTPVKHYSSGMYMRLAFSVAAHLEPEILIVDEVLAVGDAAFQQKCLGKMNEVAHEGRTVLFVSHNMGAINDLCDRCILLDEGRVDAIGTPGDVTLRYLRRPGLGSPTVDLERSRSAASLTRVGTLDGDDVPTLAIDVRKQFGILIQFENDRRIPDLQAAFAVYNQRGDRIFYHSSAYSQLPLDIGHPGPHSLIARVPGMFLVPGSYSLNVALHIPNVEMFDIREHVLAFQIEETGSGRYDYASGSAGYVFADVAWKRAMMHGESA